MSSTFGRALCVLLLLAATTVQAQKIAGRYVSKAEANGTIYHTFPETLFESREYGGLTFDITYKTGSDGKAAINFTYAMPNMTPADSVRFTANGRVLMAGPVVKFYVEPEKKTWTHRYSFATPVEPLFSFFDEATLPQITLYSEGRAYVYPVKRSAWKSYAPVGFRIFEMIRVNERR